MICKEILKPFLHFFFLQIITKLNRIYIMNFGSVFSPFGCHKWVECFLDYWILLKYESKSIYVYIKSSRINFNVSAFSCVVFVATIIVWYILRAVSATIFEYNTNVNSVGFYNYFVNMEMFSFIQFIDKTILQFRLIFSGNWW